MEHNEILKVPDMKSKLLLSYEMRRLWSVLHIVQMTRASACVAVKMIEKKTKRETVFNVCLQA